MYVNLEKKLLDARYWCILNLASGYLLKEKSSLVFFKHMYL